MPVADGRPGSSYGLRGRAPNDAEHLVPLREEQLGQKRAVLARDPGDQRTPRSHRQDDSFHACRSTDELKNAPPNLHGQQEFWGLAWEALDFIERTVTPGMATLETGAGASTIVFAASGADHETVTPSQAEADRILAECERRGISTERLTFRIGELGRRPARLAAAPARLRPRRRSARVPVPDSRLVVPPPAREGRRADAPGRRVHAAGRRGRRALPQLRGLAARAAVSFRTAVVRKLADETIDGEWKGHRMNFGYLPPGKRAVAAVRQRVFSTKAGLKAVELARPVLRRRRG